MSSFLDEAAMVGSRDMNRLLQAVQAAKAKVVLVGDAEQLQAIDAGGAFRALRERHGAVEITDIRRQQHDWQKQATRDFAQSFTEEAIGAYREKGHVVEKPTQDEARRKMIASWTACRLTSPEKTQIMMAFTRADVSDLNIEAREAYRAEGRLTGPDAKVQTDAGKKNFAAGDRLYFLQNDIHLGVRNGSLGTVEKLQSIHSGDKGHRLTVKLDDGERVTFETGEYDKFSHGYAATIHKSQGATVDRSYLLASKHMDRHGAYVGMTRHREEASLFYSEEECGSYGHMTNALSRDRRKDTTLDYLSRAEDRGKKDAFLTRILKAILPRADTDGRSAGERLFSSLKASKTMTPEQRSAQIDADSHRDQEERLLRILMRDERERSRARTFSHSM